MALAYATTLRNAQLDEITTATDADASPGQLILYDGTRPSTGGTVTNEVATLTFGDPSYGAAASGTLTAAAIVSDADATGGTTTWFRVVDGAGAFVMDGDVGTSGSDLNLNTTVIAAGSTVSVSSWVITAGNA